MRILQVVTLLSSDGAFGGPARVALNQGHELVKRGHDVTVAAASRGYPDPPTELDGVPVKMFPARTLVPATGFAGMGAPGLMRWFLQHGAEFDIVHVHFARDLVVLPVAMAARRKGVPYILQPHGMVVPSAHPLAGPLDSMWTRRVLRDAGAVCYLTPLERDQLTSVARSRLRLSHLINGVPDYPAAGPRTGPPEVLFAARLHPRKRPLAFVEMAHALLAEGADARFTLVGADEGEGTAVRAAIGGERRISWEGALPPAEVPGRVARASLYVLPSVREPYPMSVLEAMSVGLPVVVSDDCGLASLIDQHRCGIVAEPTVASLADAVRTLLSDPALASSMGDRGRRTVRAGHSMTAVGEQLDHTYRQLVGSSL